MVKKNNGIKLNFNLRKMDEIIKKAIGMEPTFMKWTVQQQFDFIKGNIDNNLIPEELEWYYDSQWGCPYEEDILKRKVYAVEY
jgi:hypothetical protein